MNDRPSGSTYWAADDALKLKESCLQKNDEYYAYLATTLLPMWRKSWMAYNKAIFTMGSVQVAGANNEYKKASINHYRNLCDHAITIAVNQRPAWQPRATNSDVESQSQTVIAKGLLDYYMKEKELADKLKRTVLYASLYAEGFIVPSWNATTGEVFAVDPETGIKQFEGDIQYDVYSPIDVIRCPTLKSADDVQWYILRDWMNKYDVIEKYAKGDEKARQALLAAKASPTDPKTQIYINSSAQSIDNDMIEVFTFIHDRTDAIPRGRQMKFTKDVMLTDGDLPYSRMNVYRCCPGELDETPFGYSNDFDVLQIQEMVDNLYSIVYTNNETFGVQNILCPNGSNTSIANVRDGMNLIKYDPVDGKGPEALNLTKSAPETYTLISILEKTMETIKGVNSVARGNPETSLHSGAALALVQSMAVQFMMGLQYAYVQMLEGVGTATINILREYASVPRVAMIAGKSYKGLMTEFSGKNLTKINRVQVDSGNPMAMTPAGNIELAQMMVNAGLIKTPEELIQVIMEGNLQPMVEGPTNELIAIKKENELMSDGKPVRAILTDNHITHIMEHKCVLSDPLVRENDELCELVLAHIQEHINILKSPQWADFLLVTGQQPLPSAQPAPGQPAGGAPPNVMSPQAEGANNLAKQMMPSLPEAPTIAGTDRQAPMPAGAAVKR